MTKVSADPTFYKNAVADGLVEEGDESCWVHDVCKICIAPRETLAVEERCALCGKTHPLKGRVKAEPGIMRLNALAKCCVDGCSVVFHPMCAVAGNNTMGECAAKQVRAPRAEQHASERRVR
jgi:hypothetical protein